jgi:hypothetical protein
LNSIAKEDYVKNRKPATIPNAVTILLTHEQIMCLDQIALDIRKNSGHPISRSAIVQALVCAALPYFEEWLDCHSEEELCHTIVGRLAVLHARKRLPSPESTSLEPYKISTEFVHPKDEVAIAYGLSVSYT